jgi:DNA repair ATPase RecN
MIRLIKLLLTTGLFALTFTTLTQATEPVVDSLSRVGPLAQAKASSEKVDSIQADDSIDESPLLEFVEKHQQPLLKLLRFMKKKQPQQYQQALKELARVKQRLTTLEKRDSESHAIELELWQVRSNLRMLVAEILVSERDSQEKLKKQLHELVEKEIDLDTARLKLEQKRMEQRLSTVQSQLAERTENRDAALSKAIKTWENRAFKSSARPKKL